MGNPRQQWQRIIERLVLKIYSAPVSKHTIPTKPELLKEYEVEAVNKKHEFWQRDPLAVPLYSQSVILQKMDYIHNNPVSGKWQLSASSDVYRFSSAAFYLTGIDEFGILTHIGKV